jgi:hypothetical protein
MARMTPVRRLYLQMTLLMNGSVGWEKDRFYNAAG